MNWQSQEFLVAELTPYPKNPRTIQTKPFEDLKDSLRKFGVADPLVINTDRTVIGGHARLLALLELGWPSVSCFVPERELTPKECEELNIRLNRNLAGEWNFGMLANGFDLSELLAWGFTKQELGVTLGDLRIDGKEFDETVAEGIELSAQITLTVSFDELESFEPRLDALLEEFPGIKKEKSA